MWELRKNVEMRKPKVVRVLCKSWNEAGRVSEQFIDEWVDRMGITLIHSAVYELDSDDGYIFVARIICTTKVYLMAKEELLRILQKERTEA